MIIHAHRFERSQTARGVHASHTGITQWIYNFSLSLFLPGPSAEVLAFSRSLVPAVRRDDIAPFPFCKNQIRLADAILQIARRPGNLSADFQILIKIAFKNFIDIKDHIAFAVFGLDASETIPVNAYVESSSRSCIVSGSHSQAGASGAADAVPEDTLVGLGAFKSAFNVVVEACSRHWRLTHPPPFRPSARRHTTHKQAGEKTAAPHRISRAKNTRQERS